MRGLALALCAGLIACARAHEAAPAALEPVQSELLQLAYAGCLRMERPEGTRCELSADRRLSFWLSSTSKPLVVQSEHGPIQPGRIERQPDGTRYELQIPLDVHQLALSAGTEASWRLELTDCQDASALAEARALRQRGQLAAAREKLDLDAPQLPAALQRRVHAELARIALQEGDYAAAASGLSQTFDLALQHGSISEAFHDGTALVFVLSTNLRDFARARAVLSQLEPLTARDDEGRALLPHYRGVLALETGDLRLGLRSFRQSVQETRRLGLREHELLAREQEAWSLSLLGQRGPAIAAQQAIADSFESDDPCQRADRYESVVWYSVLANLDADARADSSAPDYVARAARELGACTSKWRARNHLINAGLLALSRAELARAQEQLQALDHMPAVDDPLLEAWELLLRGRHALQSRSADRGLATFRRALDKSQRHQLWEPEQLAQLGIARSLRALGRSAEALAAYRATEAALDRSLFRMPLAEGLGGARHAREAGTYELVELLLAEGDAAGALAVARRARARGLALLAAQERVPSLSSDAREHWERMLARYHTSRARAAALRESSWQLPRERERERLAEVADAEQAARDALDEAYGLLLAQPWTEAQHVALAPEPAGRATLALFEMRGRLQGFAFGCGELRSIALPPQAADPGAAWLAPFAAALSCARELRVITPASLSMLDVAAWQLDGKPALERWALSYAVDSSDELPLTAAAAARRALRVVDPRGDLPLAAREAAIAFPPAFAPVRSLARASASRAELLRELPELALFHYAGHHRFAGPEGGDSELLLSDGTLSVADVLTLSAAPRFVVLSACDSAKLQAPGFAGGLDLAYAFVLKGSQAVIAATRPVRDELGYAMMAALYAELASGAEDARQWTRALQAAQRRVLAEQPGADWSAFRVITR